MVTKLTKLESTTADQAAELEKLNIQMGELKAEKTQLDAKLKELEEAHREQSLKYCRFLEHPNP